VPGGEPEFWQKNVDTGLKLRGEPARSGTERPAPAFT
jgi:hypothetical protein